MSGMVRGEIWLLGGSVCTGIALMMMYDGLRIFRWLVRHDSFGQAWRMRRIGSLPALRRSGFCSGTMTESCGAMRWRACWAAWCFMTGRAASFVYGIEKNAADGLK